MKTQSTLIALVGNTAHPSSVKTLARFKQATDPKILDNLAFSLGQFQGKPALQALTHLLTREEVLNKAIVIGAMHAFYFEDCIRYIEQEFLSLKRWSFLSCLLLNFTPFN